MKQTQNKRTGLVMGITAIMMLAMISVSLQSVYADPNEPTRPGFGKMGVFGNQLNHSIFKSFSSGTFLVDYVGDEDEDINVTFAKADDKNDKQDLLVKSTIQKGDDVADYCTPGYFGLFIPTDCIRYPVVHSEYYDPYCVEDGKGEIC